MRLIIVALQSEAEPLIDYFRLEKEKIGSFTLWKNGEITLLVSGMGPVNAAIAVTFALGRYPQCGSILNFGLCASSDTAYTIGAIFAVRKIVDTSADTVYHLHTPSQLPAASLHTFTRPQKRRRPGIKLADMEASGFYQAAKKFLPREKIAVVKVVSDYMEDRIPAREEVRQLLQRHVPLLEQVMRDQ